MPLSLYNVVGVLILHFTTLQVACNDGSESDCILTKDNQQPSPKRRGIFDFRGPNRGENYNPSYGFEPYWPLGDWVFASTPKNKFNFCGDKCPDLYYDYGIVCGRNITYGHKTFNNFCDLLNEDCTGHAKWMIAYRGKCQDPLKTYPTARSKIPTRAMEYIQDFFSRFPMKSSTDSS